MRTKYKPWAKPYIDEHPEISIPLEEMKNFSDFYLEIGSGKGDFLIKMASKFPTKLFIGVEKNVSCAGISAKKIVESKLENVRLLYIDAINLLPYIKDGSVNTIFLNFSDPWPKKRHHKRRLTSDIFLKEYLRVLPKGGRLIFKTDNIDLFNDSLEYFSNSEFKKISETNNYLGDDEFDATTEYEQYFIDEGTPINRVIYEK